MSRISRLLLNQKGSTSSDIEDEQDHSNSIEVSIANIENSLHNWNIPRVEIRTLYKQGTFDWFQSYSIKTTEKTIPLLRNQQEIKLFSSKAIQEHRKNYKFLHIGLVQVAIKPMTRLGINAPICIVLRDARLTNFNQSLLALGESNICNGPIYFQAYPDYTISLFDKNILDVLTLNLQLKEIEIKEGSDPLVLIYRVYYKTMTTTIEPKYKKEKSINETLLIESNFQNSNITVPKRIKWDEVIRNQTWNFKEIIEPKPLEINTQVNNIIDHSNGNIDIIFKNDKISSARHSYYIPSTSTNIPNLRRTQSMKFKGVDFNTSIPKPLYEDDNISDDFNDQPTRSEVEYYRENYE